MPARPREASDPPKRTPSFVCEVPLRVTPAQERTLLSRLEAARQVRVTCLGQARRRARLVRESKAYQHARTLSRDDPARKALFRAARAQHGFSEYALHAYAQPLGHSWLGEHLDSLVIQTLATRAYRAANRLLLGQARRVRGVWPTPVGHGRGQDQHERPPLARLATSSGTGSGLRRGWIRATWCRRTGWPARSSTSGW